MERNAIAIIGMAVKLPGADNWRQFWQNLKEGKDSITHFTREELAAAGIPDYVLDNPAYIKSRGYIGNVADFDADFFGYSPKEAAIIDPQQRLLLECSWAALEDAGYNPLQNKFETGIYASVGIGRYLLNKINICEGKLTDRIQTDIGNSTDYLAARVAFKLNLKGPALTIQTACSSSLVAVHQACLGLLAGDCDMALAGGISLGELRKSGYWYQDGLIYASNGKCAPFDAATTGMLPGSGMAVITLKPLEDALRDKDHIYAQILSSAINNDGTGKMTFTAPTVDGQARVIARAIQRAGLSADAISYVEAHGTGTLLGDPIELEGLAKAFRLTTNQKQFCALGSVKSNIGHTDAAAGVTGLVKTALCIYHRTLVPSLHFQKPNPYFNFKESPFFVNTSCQPWLSHDGILTAGVSSFGIGGTNAHAILQEVPVQTSLAGNSHKQQLITLSARSEHALQQQLHQLADFLEANMAVNMRSLSYTLNAGRHAFDFRWSAVCKQPGDTIRQLRNKNNETIEVTGHRRPLVFLFQGNASKGIAVAESIYTQIPFIKNEIDNCWRLLQLRVPEKFLQADLAGFFGWHTREVCSHSQAAVFVLQYSLARYLQHIGIPPATMIGYSGGEIVAACLSEVFSLSDALYLVVKRAELLDTANGRMLAIKLPADTIERYIAQLQLPIDIAATTTPDGCVVSGLPEHINELYVFLKQHGINGHYLEVNVAAHSYLLDPVLGEFINLLERITIHPPVTPYVSTLTGNWVSAAEVTSFNYWIDHFRKTVRFAEGMSTLIQDKALDKAIFLEVGPGKVLANLVLAHVELKSSQSATYTIENDGEQPEMEMEHLYQLIGKLWQYGYQLDWAALYHEDIPLRMSLPGYVFEKKTYWADTTMSSTSGDIKIVTAERPMVKEQKEEQPGSNTYITIVRDVWREVLGTAEDLDVSDNFFRIGGDSLSANIVNGLLSEVVGMHLPAAIVLKYPELGKLATYLESQLKMEQAKQQESNVVQLLRKGNLHAYTPLILVHPIGGEIFIFRDLVSQLPEEQPVYALQSPLLNGLNAGNTVSEIAAYYIQLVREAGINDTFIPVGASFGAVVAFEIARQLELSSYSVPFMVLIDPPVVPIQEEMIRLPNNTSDIQTQIHHTHYQALATYKPTICSTDILFFKPETVSVFTTTRNDFFWQLLTAGKWELHTISGDHITMNYSPNVDSIVHVLQQKGKVR